MSPYTVIAARSRPLRQFVVVLVVLILAAGTTAEVSARQPFFNVLAYSAKNDGTADASEAFKPAIKAAHNAGGGTVFVPAGRYMSGPIELPSNITLDVDAGATIAFPVAPVPFVRGRHLGVEALVPMPLISATDAENVTVTGRGVLTTGDYNAWATAYGPAPKIAARSDNANGPKWDRLLKKLEAGETATGADFRAAAPELRPSFLCFTRTRNVLIEGVRIVGAPTFAVHLLYSENATVRDVTVEAYPGPHANGIVVDSSRFVRIENDFIDTGDDGIVIKAGKDADGLRVNRPSEDVVIANCTVHRAHGAVVIGSETSGGIRNLTASNIVADGTEVGIRIKSRGGVAENVRFDNWTMQNVGKGVEVTTYYTVCGESATAEEPVSRGTPVFRNIVIRNVSIRAAKQVADIEGLPEMPIAQLRVEDLIDSGKQGIKAIFTRGLELHRVRIDPQMRTGFDMSSNTELVLDGVASRGRSQGAAKINVQY
ncbi:MAG: glycoside hydrolase family 28 protein [Terracidiphilus sp.]